MKKLIILFSLIFLFALPCTSSALSIMDLDDHGANFYGYDVGKHKRYHDFHNLDRHHQPRHHQPTPTPVPPTFWLLGTAMVGAFGIRRRLNK